MTRRIHLFPLLSAVLFVAPAFIVAEEYKVYFGLMHGHTSYSDGSGVPEEAYEMAKSAGLDFMAVTEHNHRQAAGDDGIFLTPDLYNQLKQAAAAATDGDFVAIYGQEVSTISSGNHVNIFNASSICDVPNGDFRELYQNWLPAHSEVPFIQFNHPDYREDENPRTPANQRQNDYGLDEYSKSYSDLVNASSRYVALIELIVGPAFSEETDKPHFNGKHEADYIFYLNKGFRLAPSVGQDNHNKTWGKATHARIGVWAKELTQAALFEAIQHRRCFASEDENIQAKFTLNDQMMGSQVRSNPSEPVRLSVSVSDTEETNARYRVQIFYDDAIGGNPAAVIEDERLEDGRSQVQFTHQGRQGGYYFAKITQSTSGDNDDVWTAPIWLSERDEEVDDAQTDEISWDDADQYVGQEKIVTGKIVRTHDSGRSFYLNFDPDYRTTLSLYVAAADIPALGGIDALTALSGKTIRVKGKIIVYKDMLQIQLTKPEQILSN